MGRKSRNKRNNRMWQECLEIDAQATQEQRNQAQEIYLDLCEKHPVKRSDSFARSLNRVYEQHGEIMGSLVMVEFARSEGFIRTKSPDKSLFGKEIKN
ncbi:TPA: hypothetical protein NJ362_004456 [Vibrio parahaemolyticus]|nr:hypothetical protein [Vibrio parahaemolyticus]